MTITNTNEIDKKWNQYYGADFFAIYAALRRANDYKEVNKFRKKAWIFYLITSMLCN